MNKASVTRVNIRSEDELNLMRQSGEITALALKKTLESAKVGMSLKELDQIAEEKILRLGGKPAFKNVPRFFWATCLNLNEEVVHGIPRDIKIKDGDLLKVDLGVVYKGWYTDAAWSKVVGQTNEQKEQFLNAGEQSLAQAIKYAVDGKRIGDISSEMQRVVEDAGYSIVKSLAGHGVGKSYHEAPEVPGYGTKGTGMELKEGMTLAIEVIYAQGRGEVYQKADGWTLATEDGSLAGLFENTVIVGKDKVEIITDWKGVS